MSSKQASNTKIGGSILASVKYKFGLHQREGENQGIFRGMTCIKGKVKIANNCSLAMNPKGCHEREKE